MAIFLLVEHLCWISVSWWRGITPLLSIPNDSIAYFNDPQLFTNSMTLATLSVVKVESEMESIAINIHTDFKSIHLQINLTYMYRLHAYMQNLAAIIVVGHNTNG